MEALASDTAGAEYDASYYGTDYDRAAGIPYRWGEPFWHVFFGRVAAGIADDFAPTRVLDAGCAIGFLVGALKARGIEAEGIDLSRYAISQVPLELKANCRVGSLTDPIEGRYDLVVCIEILEHIPEPLAETVIGNLCSAADTVLFSSTPDAFEEETHVNVQPAPYWEAVFGRFEFHRSPLDVRYISPQAVVFTRATGIAQATAEVENGEATTPVTSAAPPPGQARTRRIRSPRIGRQVRRALRVVWWTVSFQLPARLADRRARVELELQRGPEAYSLWAPHYDILDDADLDGARRLGASLSWQPLVSIVMPVFDPPLAALEQAIDSIRAQTYERWQLCIADDASTDVRVVELLDRAGADDSRIDVIHRTENGGISAATNSALAHARGELVGFVDHDDILRPHALALMVKAFNDSPDVGWAYSDEDLLSPEGERVRPYFKPDWSPTLLCCQNVLNHFSLTRADLVREVGGLRGEFDGSQDWDLALRVTERLTGEQVVHVPHVLYHWRMVEGSAAESSDAKPYALDAGRRATLAHLARVGVAGATLTGVGSHHRVSFPADTPQKQVAVVVPTIGEPERVRSCLDGLLAKTLYEQLEIVFVVDPALVHGPEGEALRNVVGNEARLVPRTAGPFNFSDACNHGVAAATAPFILLLNDDVEPITPDWLHRLVGQARRPGVGVVGALLLYPETNRIQHAGVVLGAGDVADHLYRHKTLRSAHINRALLSQELSAVTGACMLVRREALADAGGLDPAFAVAYNDIDLCLRIQGYGWRCVYEPGAVMYHHEGASFGSHRRGRTEEYLAEVALMQARWARQLAEDPYHNPNLGRDACSPGQLAFPPRVAYPWRSAAVGERGPVSQSG